MNVVLYHEVSSESVGDVLKEGIKRRSGGVKRNSEIDKVDRFLDSHLPDLFEAASLNRCNVTYAYLEHEGKIIDITNGELVAVEEFKRQKGMKLLRLTVDSEDCYVSDLDLYDTLMRAMELDEQDSTREHLADRYWEKVVPIDEFEFGMIHRPEVMINADVDSQNIEVIEKD